jgi:type I restriction enzyme S subunit
MVEWKSARLGDIASPEDGAIAIGPFGSAMKAETYSEVGVPVIRGTNVSDTRAWKGDWVFIPEEFADAMPRCVAKSNDLVFPHRGSIGEVAIVPSDRDRYFLSSSLMKIRVSESIADPLFVYYYFRSKAGRAEILRFGSQVGTPGIGQPLTSLKQFRLPLPPLVDQHRIAALLSVLDDKIELNRRMNEMLEEMVRAIFKDWFVDFGPTRAKMEGRTPYLAPDIWTLFPDRFDDEGKPEGWVVRPLVDCFDLLMGQSPPGDTYNDIGEGLPFFQGRTDFGFRFPQNRKYCTAPGRLAERADTLVSVRAPVGDINIASERCCIGRGVAALRHKNGATSFTYYTAWALQDELRQYENTGTVFGAINRRQFEKLPTIDSGSAVIRAFEKIANVLDNRIEHNELESRTLADMRDFLLPKLMSGEARVMDTERLIGEAK